MGLVLWLLLVLHSRQGQHAACASVLSAPHALSAWPLMLQVVTMPWCGCGT